MGCEVSSCTIHEAADRSRGPRKFAPLFAPTTDFPLRCRLLNADARSNLEIVIH